MKLAMIATTATPTAMPTTAPVDNPSAELPGAAVAGGGGDRTMAAPVLLPVPAGTVPAVASVLMAAAGAAGEGEVIAAATAGDAAACGGSTMVVVTPASMLGRYTGGLPGSSCWESTATAAWDGTFSSAAYSCLPSVPTYDLILETIVSELVPTGLINRIASVPESIRLLPAGGASAYIAVAHGISTTPFPGQA